MQASLPSRALGAWERRAACCAGLTCCEECGAPVGRQLQCGPGLGLGLVAVGGRVAEQAGGGREEGQDQRQHGGRQIGQHLHPQKQGEPSPGAPFEEGISRCICSDLKATLKVLLLFLHRQNLTRACAPEKPDLDFLPHRGSPRPDALFALGDVLGSSQVLQAEGQIRSCA